MPKPGRELDALIAEKIFRVPNEFIAIGIKNSELPPQSGPVQIIRFVLAHYSTDLADAWEVVEELQRWKFTLTWEADFGGGGQKSSMFATAIFDPVLTKDRKTRLAKAETAPHAICLAALKAIDL
jgi:hypothetical protein